MREPFKRLANHFKRTDRKKKCNMLREQVTALAALLETLTQSGIDIDPRIVAWINGQLTAKKKQERFLKVAGWIGAPQTRFLLNYSGNSRDYLATLMRQWLDSETGAYDFGGLKLPLPVTDRDKSLWSILFEDIIIYYLLDSFDPMAISKGFIGNEGPYEPNDRVCLHENDVVFDCGANIGAFAALAAVKGGRVYAFEPSHHIRETYLEKTAALNGGFVICPYALSDSPGTLEFVVNHNNLGASHINRPEENVDANYGIETVEAVRLDDFVEDRGIEKVDFIKVDIEGAERKMLMGAENILKRFSPKLSICTYHLPDDPQVLRDIILSAQPRYNIIQGPHKLYAHLG